MNNLTEEQCKMMKNMGALGYGSDKISIIMGFELTEIENGLNDQSSQLFKMYKEGKDYASYIIDLKLFEMAQSGDIKALEKLEKRQKYNQPKKKSMFSDM